MPEPIQLPIVWVGVDDRPIKMANQFVVQLSGPGEIILTIGQAAPPMTLGTPEEQQAQLRGEFAQVHALARVGLSVQRVKELIGILQSTLDTHGRIFGGDGTT